jgi:hypothetical protein
LATPVSPARQALFDSGHLVGQTTMGEKGTRAIVAMESIMKNGTTTENITVNIKNRGITGNQIGITVTHLDLSTNPKSMIIVMV